MTRRQHVRRRAVEFLERAATLTTCDDIYDLWYHARYSAAAVLLAESAYYALCIAHLHDPSPHYDWQTLCAAAACLLRQGWEPEL